MNKLSLVSSASALFSTLVLCGASAQGKNPDFLLLTGLIVIFIVIPTVFFAFFTKRK